MSGAALGLALAVAVLAAALAAVLAAGEVALARATRSGLVDAESEARASGSAARLQRVERAQVLVEDDAATAQAVAVARVVAQWVAVAAVVVVLDGWFDAWWLVLLVTTGVAVLVAVALVRVSPATVGRANPVGVVVALASLLGGVAALTRWALPVPEESLPAPERTDREAREVADRMSESEEIEDDERELIRSVIELGQTLTREIMVPRTDMITTRATTPLAKTLTLFQRSGFSRIPVTGTDTDDLVGVAFFKDVVAALHARADEALTVGDVVRPAMFVPESKPVDELMREMQAASSHIALVVDEYGGVAGLVTIEDALEELVGELTDEHDQPEPEVEALDDDTYRVPARWPIGELGELFGLHIDEDDVDSVGGLLAKSLGKVPLAGATAEAHGLVLAAERIEGRRKQLATVLVHRAPEPPEHESSGAGRPAEHDLKERHR
ncbi:CBS domain containing-hemolysin-like protein [Sediminihabitans luteus]|uniref:CBS domain containing-hemolysin-like protein n=1 Tax=Sediminihabitans luteus TaxID=1138585 RepID=A0A2M9CPV9_9CELL|nr:hemolysin family protein [Sediminihabitans luteus]PJJ73934.1 CBS domain containing-hemolysin-like protein [Sediminihabitans luteus]GII98153.1 hypothetical protein Slu03_05310 [Sediminihabitans luteus]